MYVNGIYSQLPFSAGEAYIVLCCNTFQLALLGFMCEEYSEIKTNIYKYRIIKFYADVIYMGLITSVWSRLARYIPDLNVICT